MEIEFLARIEEAVQKFKEFGHKSNKSIKIVSHLDADGICACAILTKALSNENRHFSISILPQLDRRIIMSLAEDTAGLIIFSDFGSGQIDAIKKFLSGKKIIILDHHQPQNETIPENFVHVNPHLFGIDGSKEISGAGVSYLFAKALNKKNRELAHLAIIGAIGDNQENYGFIGINSRLLELAERCGKISVQNGLRLFGANTRPIHKLLEYCFTPYIPGVTGTETGAIAFLKSLGINPKKGSKWKMLEDLTKEEQRRLLEGLILRRMNEETPEAVYGPIYTICEETGMLRDAKEFSTVLNACGRLDKASLGIGICLGDNTSKERVFSVVHEYKRQIMEALKWYEEQSENIVSGEGFIIINAKNELLPTMVGTLASIISRSVNIPAGTYILSMARTEDFMVKVSLRIAGKANADLNKTLGFLVERVGGQAGGHKSAAGALIPQNKEQLFVEIAKTYFARGVIEEKI
ncbi:MAG: DHH family phosphoesterase [Candidatus Woesearchaeota archaeon]